MNIFQAIILGIIQGLSEFLPISSTAHLTLAGKYMGLISETNPERWTAFIAVVQLGTLAAILIYFAKELFGISNSFIKENLKFKKYSEQSDNSKLGWKIIIGSIPIATLGLLFKKLIEGKLTKEMDLIGANLIIFALILFVIERFAKFRKDVATTSVWDTIVIGLSQVFSLLPGASRSGTTISGGLLVGLKRDEAARFSFLLSIPAVFASGLLELKHSLTYINSQDALNLAIATLFAFVSGYISIGFLIKYLKTHTNNIFIVYRIIIGVIILSFAC